MAKVPLDMRDIVAMKPLGMVVLAVLVALDTQALVELVALAKNSMYRLRLVKLDKVVKLDRMVLLVERTGTRVAIEWNSPEQVQQIHHSLLRIILRNRYCTLCFNSFRHLTC